MKIEEQVCSLIDGHSLRELFLKVDHVSLAVEDLQELQKLTQFLDTHGEYDGATGMTTHMRVKEFDTAKTLFEQSSCGFSVRFTVLVNLRKKEEQLFSLTVD